MLEDMPVTADQIRTWTRQDTTLSSVMQFTQSGWPSHIQHGEDQLKPFWRKHLELMAQEGCLLCGNRVIVPPPGRIKVLQELHEAHPGTTRMKRLTWTFVWWPGID